MLVPMSSRGELEQRVMELLWASAVPMSVADVHTKLSEERELAYTTVMTVLDRLAKKGMASRTRDGRAWRYTADASREELAATALRSALDNVQADRKLAMLHFLDDASPAELDDLKAALAEVERRHT